MGSVYLMYHDIITDKDNTSGFQNDSAFQYKVLEKKFENHLHASEGKDVVFTFDDGGVSFYTKVAPMLEKYGRRGIFFIATDYIGMPGFLTMTQILELHQRGHIIGSHSCSHPQNMASMENDKIIEEWRNSAEKLSSIIGTPIKIASIPNGYSSVAIVKGAQYVGFEELYNSEPTTKIATERNLRIIGRFVVHADMSIEEIQRIINSSQYRRLLHLKWQLLNMIKFALGSNYNKIKSLFIKFT